MAYCPALPHVASCSVRISQQIGSVDVLSVPNKVAAALRVWRLNCMAYLQRLTYLDGFLKAFPDSQGGDSSALWYGETARAFKEMVLMALSQGDGADRFASRRWCW